jgi:hypothetical protein
MDHTTERQAGIGIAIAAAVGAGIVGYATTAGVGLLSDDSFLYADLAMDLRGGHALSSIAVPPGYPLVLALGADPFATARVVNLLAIAALVAVIGGAVWWSTQRVAPALFAASLAAFAKPLLVVHAMMLSEPLALVLGTAGLWLTLVALDDDRPWRWSVAALALGLAPLARYAAVIYPAAAVFFVMWERRWRRAALLAGLSALPLTAWLVRNMLAAGAATDRVLVYHPIRPRVMEWGRDAVNVWFDPLGILFGGHPALRWFGVAAPALLFAWGSWRGDRLARLASLFAIGYVVFVLMVIEFLDVTTIFDTRLLVPVFVAAVFVGASILEQLLEHRRWAGWAMGVAALFLLAHGLLDVRFARRVHPSGLGATITTWRASVLAAAVNALPPGTPVWTNSVLQLPWVSKAEARALPRPLIRTSGLPWAGYDSALAAIPAGAYVAQFGDSTGYLGAAARDLMRTRGMDIVAEAPEGRLYRVR